jgi:hypothetical protein
MLAMIEEMCPYRKQVLEDMSLSARTCATLTEKLGANLFEQCKTRAKSFDCYAFAVS